MFEQSFIPRSFCREFVEFRKSAHQIVSYMALVLGIKPLTDDWIPPARLSQFEDICSSYGLFVRADAIHYSVDPRLLSEKVVGREFITTTSALGFPINTDIEKTVHVFVSKERERLKRGMWYPVVVRNRLITQPRIDVLKFGYDLGYPECCIEFFRKYNNWSRYNFLDEIYKNTKGDAGYHYYCNPFTKDYIYSYIYHMPCSFNCVKTIELVERLRSEIGKREPGFVDAIDRHLNLPFLVLFERKFFAFSGFIQDERLYYSEVYYPDGWRPNLPILSFLKKGDNLHIDNKRVYVYKGRRPVAVIDAQKRGEVSENPRLMQFRSNAHEIRKKSEILTRINADSAQINTDKSRKSV